METTILFAARLAVADVLRIAHEGAQAAYRGLSRQPARTNASAGAANPAESEVHP
jgi:hypothetical protein